MRPSPKGSVPRPCSRLRQRGRNRRPMKTILAPFQRAVVADGTGSNRTMARMTHNSRYRQSADCVPDCPDNPRNGWRSFGRKVFADGLVAKKISSIGDSRDRQFGSSIKRTTCMIWRALKKESAPASQDLADLCHASHGGSCSPLYK
jgi:hypothetical protein